MIRPLLPITRNINWLFFKMRRHWPMAVRNFELCNAIMHKLSNYVIQCMLILTDQIAANASFAVHC